MKLFLFPVLFLLFAGTFYSCHKDENNPTPEDPTLPTTQRINKFIAREMKDIYYWAAEVKDREVKIDKDPQDFLTAMRYKEDEWSILEEDETITKSATEGSEVGMGYKIIFYRISESQNKVVGMIRYVYSGSPAAKAGLRRGDMIVKNNGEWITTDNYRKIYSDATVKLNTGTIASSNIYVYEDVFELTATSIEINPIQLDTVLQVEGRKIGYLVYTSFVDNQSNSLSDLSQVFVKFKNAQLDEFILDLRYNTGGMETAARHLSSLLAPASAVQQEKILIREQWNETYAKKFQNTPTQTEVHFNSDLLVYNLDLRKIYILIGDWTASASEVVISGLRPYLPNIVLIGEKTIGKYVGSTKRVPSDADLKRWALWPITFAYTNADGENVKGGIAPDYTTMEYSNYLPPFGDSEDPFLAKALELITGKPDIASLTFRSFASPKMLSLNADEGKKGLLLTR